MNMGSNPSVQNDRVGIADGSGERELSRSSRKCPAQVLPLLSLLVKSGQAVLNQTAEVIEPGKPLASLRSALLRLACHRYWPLLSQPLQSTPGAAGSSQAANRFIDANDSRAVSISFFI